MFIFHTYFLIVKNNHKSFSHKEIKIAINKQSQMWISPSLLLSYYIFDKFYLSLKPIKSQDTDHFIFK